MKSYADWLTDLGLVLRRLEVEDMDGQVLTSDQGFRELLRCTTVLRRRRGTLFLIGNGASASMASHMAADLCKNGDIRTRVFTDAALVTATANDCGVGEMFAEPLQQYAEAEDMLVAISSSGNSPNICAAAERALELGLDVVTFTAMARENQLRHMGTLNFYVPADTYGLAESAHASLLHLWVDQVLVEKKARNRYALLPEAASA